MSVSSSFTFSPTAEALLRQAFIRCGLLAWGRPLPNGALNDGLDIMNTILASNEGRRSRITQEERTSQVLTAGVGTYTLAADTLDILEPVTLLLSDGRSENVLCVAPWAEYGEIPDKTVTGTPIRVFFDRTSTFSMVLDPIPTAALTVKYRRVRLMKIMEAGQEADMHKRWLNWLVLATASAVASASNLPESRVLRIKAEAEVAYKEARGGEADVGDLRFELGGGRY